MIHKIIIAPSRNSDGNPRHSSRGALFDASFEGETIVTGSTQPLLDACRVLNAKGLSGPVEMWDNVLPYYRFKTDIDKAAGLTIREGDGLPRLVRFESLAPGDITQPFSAAGGIPVAQTENGRSGKMAAAGMAGEQAA